MVPSPHRTLLGSSVAIMSAIATLPQPSVGQPLALNTGQASAIPQEAATHVLPTVTLTLNNVSRDSAIRAVVAAAGFDLVFSRQFVKLNGQVSARFSKTPLNEAVGTVLRGSSVVSKISAMSKSVLLAPDTTTRSDTSNSAKPARLRGRVIDAESRRGIQGAIVELGGTQKTYLTDAEGLFRLGDLSPGKYVLAVRRLGYGSLTQTVALDAGQDTLVVMPLNATSTTLTTVVTTGSGDRQKYQVGNSIATIDAADVAANELVRNISDLLANRAQGLQVLRGTGAVGSPSRLRVRGTSSILASNAPIIMLDGVRISGDHTASRDQSLPGWASSPSRLDDIDPDIIESIEVLKGPAASTLFGSDAANGVIVIKTKRGRAGPTRWTARMEQGLSYHPNDYPLGVKRLGYPLTGGKGNECSLLDEAQGRCVPLDTVLRSNLLSSSATTPVAQGGNTSFGVDVSGGVPTLQYFFSGSHTNELGTAKLPSINARLISQSRGGNDLPGWMKRPNEQSNTNVSGRLSGQFSGTSDFSLGVNFVQLDNRIGADGMSGLLSDVRGPGDTIKIVPGWETFNLERKQSVTRAIGSATGNWRPLPWLAGNMTYGWDFSLRDAKELNRRNSCLPICSDGSSEQKGSIRTGRQTLNVQSVSMGGTASMPLGSRFTLRSAVGGQFVRNGSHEARATASELAEGGTSIEQALDRPIAEEVGDESAIAGVYLDESLSFNDRLFFGAAIRRDVSSALGSSVTPLYPKWSLSWVASEEPFFPWNDFISLRFRAAFGHAGVQPDGTLKYRLYDRLAEFIGENGDPDGKYAWIYAIGNLDLRPERSVEREAGFELGFLQDRFILDVTMFRKTTRDAIVQRPLAPSMDFGSQAQNIGKVLNTGTEASLSARMLQRSSVSWDLRLGYASRRNKLVQLGHGVEPFNIGDQEGAASVIEGYPLFSRWARPIVGYKDVNGDGIIVPEEVRVGDSLQYIGPSTAKYDLSILNSIGLLQDRIRMSANFQYVNGLVQLNQYRSTNWGRLPISHVKGSSLKEQAYVVASNGRPYGTQYGFFENVDFLRFTELSMSYTAPVGFAQQLRVRSATFSLLASNLGIWTNYNGRDPDVNTRSAAGNEYFNGAAFPQPRSWAFRVNLNF